MVLSSFLSIISISIKIIESIIKPSHKITPSLAGMRGNLTKHLKEETFPVYNKLFQRIEREITFSHLSLEANKTQTPKLNQDITRKEQVQSCAIITFQATVSRIYDGGPIDYKGPENFLSPGDIVAKINAVEQCISHGFAVMPVNKPTALLVS